MVEEAGAAWVKAHVARAPVIDDENAHGRAAHANSMAPLIFGSASFSVGLFSVHGAHQSGKKIEQETRRRGGKRRERLILSGKHLPLLRSLRLRVSCSMFSSLAVQ
jgi:hypothetical protein